MRRFDFTNFFQPLLRATGLVLLFIFVIQLVSQLITPSSFQDPAYAIDKVQVIMDFSPLLILAASFLVLSLANYSRTSTVHDRERKIPFKDLLILNIKLIMLIFAIAYFCVIPYTIMQAQTLRNIGARALDTQLTEFTKYLQSVRRDFYSENNSDKDVPNLKRQHATALGPAAPRLDTLEDLRQHIDRLIKDVKPEYNRRIAEADKDMLFRMIRTTLMCLTYGSCLIYFWLHWPSKSLALNQDKEAIKSLELIGVEDPIREEP